MSKKKLGTLLIAAILAIGTVAGTFAWFTSQDEINNKFDTLGQIDPADPNGENAGIQVWENFDTASAAKVTPGSVVNKKVQVKSTTDYDQFVRVKLTPQWTDVPNMPVGPTADITLLELDFVNLAADLGGVQLGEWVDGGDGYFYYYGILATTDVTSQLLDTVKLSGTASNYYKGAKFEVLIEAEAVQASNDAILSLWGDNAVTQKINTATVFDGVEIVGAQHIH